MDVKTLNPVIIGGGALGGSVARGLKRAGIDPVVADPSEAVRQALEARGIKALADSSEALASSNGPVLVALKPWMMMPVCADLKDLLKGRLCCSMAALVEIKGLAFSAPEAHWGRAMTNIASAVGAGFTGVARGSWSDEEMETMMALFRSFGDALVVEEKDIDGIIGISGSAIAYIFSLLEGFIQGGLAVGLKRDLSLRAGIGTLTGAAELVRQSGAHPAELRDQVCTPGGTTIAAIRTLERTGFKSAFIEAVVAAAESGKAGAEEFRNALNAQMENQQPINGSVESD